MSTCCSAHSECDFVCWLLLVGGDHERNGAACFDRLWNADLNAIRTGQSGSSIAATTSASKFPSVAGRRRERLEAALDALNARTRARLVKVVGEERPAEAAELVGTRFDRLPDGVELTPSSLHIEFQGREEFLERLGAVIFALENDTERVLGFVDTPHPDSNRGSAAGVVVN